MAKLTIDQQITYLHRRIARLERNNGSIVHPHPTETSVEEQTAADAVAKLARELEAKRKKDASDKAAVESANRRRIDDASLSGPLDPSDPASPWATVNPNGPAGIEILPGEGITTETEDERQRREASERAQKLSQTST